MKSEILKRISEISSFNELIRKLNSARDQDQYVFCSPLHGVSKSLLVLKLNETENQIVLLLPDSKKAEELFVELNIIGPGEQ